VVRLKDRVAATLLEVGQRNVAGEGQRLANVNRALPINFCGGPDEIVTQLQEAREKIGCGVVDLSFQTPGLGRPRRADGSARTIRQKGAAAHPRHLKIAADEQARSSQAIDSQFDRLRVSRNGPSCPKETLFDDGLMGRVGG
jgi:hypothetical protein